MTAVQLPISVSNPPSGIALWFNEQACEIIWKSLRKDRAAPVLVTPAERVVDDGSSLTFVFHLDTHPGRSLRHDRMSPWALSASFTSSPERVEKKLRHPTDDTRIPLFGITPAAYAAIEGELLKIRLNKADMTPPLEHPRKPRAKKGAAGEVDVPAPLAAQKGELEEALENLLPAPGAFPITGALLRNDVALVSLFGREMTFEVPADELLDTVLNWTQKGYKV